MISISHFTCLVIGEDFDKQLAPFDEDIQVARYKVYWDSDQRIAMERVLSTAEGDYTVEAGTALAEQEEPYTDEQLVAVYNARYGREDFEESGCAFDDGGVYEWSTYNPQPKWDWYTVGGRWRGYFKLRKYENEQEAWHAAHDYAIKNGAENGEAISAADRYVARRKDVEPTIGAPGSFDNEPVEDGRADVLLRGDADLEAMRDEAGELAGELWQRVHAAIDDLPVALSWREMLAKHTPEGSDTPNLDLARKEYHDQPRVKALAGALGNDLGLFGPSVEDFQVSLEEYVEAARDGSVAPFSWLADGKWHEPGKMGWFGMSTETPMTLRYYRREFNEMIDALPFDTRLTLVDLHI